MNTQSPKDKTKPVDYARGYAIGYIKAVRDFQNRLVFDEDTQTIHLTTLLNWLQDRETHYLDVQRKLLEEPKL